jgi:diamine N-acetyltransferase
MSFKIHLASEEDVNHIVDIAKKTHRETFPDLVDGEDILDFRFGRKFLEEAYFSELKSGNVIYYLVKDKDKIVGYAKLIFEGKEAKASLDKIYLLKDYQGKKIGFRLLQQCFQDTLRRNIKKMYLAVNIQNPAMQFYQKHGFYRTGKFIPPTPNSSKITDEIMQCDDVSQFLKPYSRI